MMQLSRNYSTHSVFYTLRHRISHQRQWMREQALRVCYSGRSNCEFCRNHHASLQIHTRRLESLFLAIAMYATRRIHELQWRILLRIYVNVFNNAPPFALLRVELRPYHPIIHDFRYNGVVSPHHYIWKELHTRSSAWERGWQSWQLREPVVGAILILHSVNRLVCLESDESLPLLGSDECIYQMLSLSSLMTTRVSAKTTPLQLGSLTARGTGPSIDSG